jgi:choline dehydrogenase
MISGASTHIECKLPYRLVGGFTEYPIRVSQCSEAMGFKSITDANSPYALSDGLATLDQSINRNRERSSTFSAFVPKEIALKRQKNLTICTRVAVSRLIFSDGLLVFSGGSQPRAEGVRFQSVTKSDKSFSAKARKEVIVCSGALGSPQVLMLRFVLSKGSIRRSQTTNFMAS